MSLALLLDWRPWEAEGLRMEPDGRVTPWPFATESLTVRCEGRLLTEPGADLRAAPWVELSYELTQ
jgi:hypothetical protein